MGPWGPLPEAELAVERERRRLLDEKVAAAYEVVNSIRKDVKPPTQIEKRLPKSIIPWLRNRLNTKESLEALHDAEVEHLWAVYATTSSRRTLYPRKRPITPSDPAFDARKQLFDANQSQSLFFQKLPPEMRAEIYRSTFGGCLIVQIEASHSGFGGPPPSRDHRVFWGSKVTKLTGEEFMRGQCYPSSMQTKKWKPSILPLLQSCRKIYDEAIPILYGEMLFKTHEAHNSVEWSKYLLRPRLNMIRTAHLQLTLGYPWEAPCIIMALEAIVNLPNLQKACILGKSNGMIDCNSKRIFIDEALWMQKKNILMKPIRRLKFVREVDVFLPMHKKILAKFGEENIGHIRIHGLTDEEMQGKTAVYCACKHFPEKMKIFRGS